MNPTDIFETLEATAQAPFDPAEFGFSFAEVTDNARATVSKLRGGSLNRSDIDGGVLMNAKFHCAPADALGVEGHCCKSLSAKDSLCESMRLDAPREQAIPRPLSHDELVQLQRVAAQAGIPADLGG